MPGNAGMVISFDRLVTPARRSIGLRGIRAVAIKALQHAPCAYGRPVQAGFGCHNQTHPLPGFSSGRLTSTNVATWVLSNQDSNVAPQTLQDA